MKSILTGLIVFYSILGIGCGGSKTVSENSLAHEKSPGKVAFEQNCQTCHRLPSPWSQTDEEWPALVVRYGERAKIDVATVNLIVAHLQKSN